MVEQGDLSEETIARETPQLVSLLKEMKDGLDTVRSKVQALTEKVKQSQLPTSDGMSYLEVKHLLLLNYCQSIVYYTLRKAKGLSIEGHPVVRSLVEIRLFLEKIRPIDKKLEYQVQKLTRAATGGAPAGKALQVHEEQKKVESREEDPLRYRPNPDMLASKTSQAQKDIGGVYRPPKFAPTSMDDDKMSKEEKQALRRDKALLRQTKQSSYMKELMDEFEDKPEEVREIVGSESRELSRYIAKREEQAQREEELFTRAPVTKREKRVEKYMKNSRNGLLSLTDDFHNEIRTLPLEEKEKENTLYINNGGAGKRFKKRKRH
ncbi:neuroguidin isoform X2 [Dendrobium catenatum]|uniref:neuroguidin isoform X2 n=1 Tax=Dendrobium catenatum TaxID=906689 RepID=UPI0009F429BE|nr:neuroguidin isoform X2 [Dendrobium catenatum]